MGSLKDNCKEVVIYGAGEYGTNTLKLLTDFNVKVLKFCDSNENKWGQTFLGLEIISPEELNNNYGDKTVALGFRDDMASMMRAELLKRGVINENNTLGANMPYHLTFGGNDGKAYIFNPTSLRRMQKNVIAEGKKLIFWGHINDIVDLTKKLKFMDILLDSAISQEGFVGETDGVKFIDRWDLCFEKNALVWALPSAEEETADFILESNADNNVDFCGNEGINVSWKSMFDPTVGYAFRWHDSNGVVELINHEDKNTSVKKIAVLGGSTTDSKLFFDKSWPEQLQKVAIKENINIDIISFATAGYNSAQEFLRLARDVVEVKPDIVISYSGINDYISAYFQNYFIHKYQAQLFGHFNRSDSANCKGIKKQQGVYYGIGLTDYVKNWIKNERMMRAICDEFDIKFYGILQPSVGIKEPPSFDEREVAEHYLRNYLLAGVCDTLKNISKAIKEYNEPWMIDFTHILDEHTENMYWDPFHLTTKGNYVLAEKIFEVIRKDLTGGNQ